jgi:hypothetical protein
MSTKTEIANIALSHLGVGREIANIETENSQEANAMRRFYDISREQVLRDFNWPFATKEVTLGLVSSNPTTEWTYAYRYPADALKLRRIFSGIRNDTRQTRVPYKLVRDNAGRLIYTDAVDACMEYTYAETDASRFTPDFVQALACRMAAYAAPRLTSGDPFKLGERAYKLYVYEITKAQATAANEVQDEEKPDAEWINARDGGTNNQQNRNDASGFVWP